MRALPKPWNIFIITQRQAKINPKPQYQRPAVWNLAKNQLLIDSILRGYDLPKIYLRASEEAGFEFEVVDGQQRLRAIWNYLSDGYPLGEESKDLPQGDLSGLKFSELSSEAKDQLGMFDLTVFTIEDASDLEIRDLFLRLQNGVSLNAAEKRNAMVGTMRDFVAEIADEPHKALALSRISSDRYGWHDLIALVVGVELASGPADVKATDLRKMYKDNESFDTEGTIAKRVKRNLNILARVLKEEPPEMDIKWGFLDLYLLVSTLDREYNLTGRENDLLRFFRAFELQRRQAIKGDIADLLSGDEWDRELYDYIQAFTTQGGQRANVETRHRVYLNRARRDIPDIVPKDPRRAFTRDERLIIWRRAHGLCQHPGCALKLDFKDMHADHIVPHARGGVTTIENAQSLCQMHNLSKGGT
jgi:hypothetical protein